MEKEQEFLGKVKSQVAESIEAVSKTFVKSEELEKTKSELLEKIEKSESVKDLKEKLNDVALEMKSIAEKSQKKSKGLKSVLEENIGEIKSAVEKKVAYDMHIKADSIGTISTIDFTNHTEGPVVAPQYMDGIIKERRNPFNILQYVNFGRALSPIIYWVERINEEGTAQFIDECTLKPLVDFDLQAKNETAKKVAVRAKVCTEIIHDIPQLQSEIETHLRTLVAEEITKQILSGDGTGDNLKGIQSYASAYTVTDLTASVKTPTITDVIDAAYTTLTCMYCMPDYVFMNCSDIFRMRTEKDADGNRFIPVTAPNSSLVIGSVRVIESNYIPAGSFLMGDYSKSNVKMWEDIRLEIGFENDDFSKNLRTLIAEARLLHFISDIDSSCFIFDTFANVIADIEKP